MNAIRVPTQAQAMLAIIARIPFNVMFTVCELPPHKAAEHMQFDAGDAAYILRVIDAGHEAAFFSIAEWDGELAYVYSLFTDAGIPIASYYSLMRYT